MAAGVHYDSTLAVERELYNVKSGYRLAGGFNLDLTGIDAFTHIPTLAPLELNFSERKAYAVKNIKVVEAADAAATTLKIAKGSFAKTSQKYRVESGYVTISAIDTSNDDYDALTVSALPSAVAVGSILTEATVTIYKKSAAVYANAASAATTVKIAKNSGFVVPTGGSLVLTDGTNDVTVSAIDTSNSSYDSLTVTALTAALTANTSTLTEKTGTGETITSTHTANALNYDRRKIEAGQTVTALGAAYEIDEANLYIPVTVADKAKLTDRFMFIN